MKTKESVLILYFIIALLVIGIINLVMNRQVMTIVKTHHEAVVIIDQNDETDQFVEALRTFEQDPKIGLKSRRSTTDSIGNKHFSQYIGAWQIGDAARESTGYKHLNNETGYNLILKDSALQVEIVKALIRFNIKVLDYYIKCYDHTKVGKYYITKSGIIAMAHLVGAGAVINFFDSNGRIVAKDGAGVSMTKYLELNGFILKL